MAWQGRAVQGEKLAGEWEQLFFKLEYKDGEGVHKNGDNRSKMSFRGVNAYYSSAKPNLRL